MDLVGGNCDWLASLIFQKSSMNGFTNYWHQIADSIRPDISSQRLAERVLYQLWNFDQDQNTLVFQDWCDAIAPALIPGLKHEVIVQSVLGRLWTMNGLDFAPPPAHGTQKAFEPTRQQMDEVIAEIQSGWSAETRKQREDDESFCGLARMIDAVRIVAMRKRHNKKRSALKWKRQKQQRMAQQG